MWYGDNHSQLLSLRSLATFQRSSPSYKRLSTMNIIIALKLNSDNLTLDNWGSTVCKKDGHSDSLRCSLLCHRLMQMSLYKLVNPRLFWCYRKYPWWSISTTHLSVVDFDQLFNHCHHVMDIVTMPPSSHTAHMYDFTSKSSFPTEAEAFHTSWQATIVHVYCLFHQPSACDWPLPDTFASMYEQI